MSATPSTILVVEDDAIVRMLIVDVLEELEFNVLEAEGSERALELLEDKSQRIDLLMTDVGLPDMDGRALAQKARELHQHLPILFASGYAETLVAKLIDREGLANDFHTVSDLKGFCVATGKQDWQMLMQLTGFLR